MTSTSRRWRSTTCPACRPAGLSTGTAVAPFPIESDYNASPSSVMQDVRVRQAFMYGCDRQGFVDTFLQGKGQKVDSYFLPAWIPKDGTKTYPFDLKKAKELLDAAKADGKFDYGKAIQWMNWNKNARDRQSFVEACQASLATIGVKVEIINGAEVTTAKGQQGDWDLQLYGGYPVQDPNTLTQPLSCAQIGKTKRANGFLDGGSNLTNWCNKEFDTLMTQGKSTADQAQRATHLRQGAGHLPRGGPDPDQLHQRQRVRVEFKADRRPAVR